MSITLHSSGYRHGEIPVLPWGETKHWNKALSIREQKGKDKHPGWQTHCLRERKGIGL